MLRALNTFSPSHPTTMIDSAFTASPTVVEAISPATNRIEDNMSNELPTVQIDKNLVTLYTPTVTLWFSYRVLIAFRIGAEKVVHQNDWSTTTGRHLNAIEPDKKKRVTSGEFFAKWRQLSKAAVQLAAVNHDRAEDGLPLV